jgi:hypothetical protein
VLIGFLLLSWMWDRVTTSCHGTQDTISHYYFQATMRVPGTGSCPTGKGNQTEPCTIMIAATPVPFGPNISEPSTGTTVFTYIDPVDDPDMLPIPQVGGLAAWPWPTADNPNPVVAVDKQGNRCDQVCK